MRVEPCQDRGRGHELKVPEDFFAAANSSVSNFGASANHVVHTGTAEVCRIILARVSVLMFIQSGQAEGLPCGMTLPEFLILESSVHVLSTFAQAGQPAIGCCLQCIHAMLMPVFDD